MNQTKQAVDELINEARVFYQSLVQASEDLHRADGLSLGMRAVLEYLLREGSETVPNMARQRRVTRQRIQTLTNQLLELGFVESRDNPATKRSPLIELTEAGRAQINLMRVSEAALVRAVQTSDSQLRIATQVLQEVRESWETLL